uniref:BZIP domain-containing protein n=1 Tax=Gouania willdenowi TaxID=441366 RepID=A0A8C5DV93_GOUWI
MLAPEAGPSTINGPLFDFLVGPGLLKMMAPEAGPSTINGAHQPVDAETYKKKLRLLTNKKAVHLYRQKKKLSEKNLTDHVAMLEKLNSKLKQDLKSLKEIYQKTPVCKIMRINHVLPSPL